MLSQIPQATDMTNAHKRKKQPELVRRTLVDCAAQLAVEHGLGAVTIQAVADAAGVTKGGLMHHFPTKQALVEAVFADLLEQLDEEIDRYLAEDDIQNGRFTRAYLKCVFADRENQSDSYRTMTALCVSSITDPDLRRLWGEWIARRIAQHAETDSGPELEIVRFAADGIWLYNMLDDATPQHCDHLYPRLIKMTH